MANGEKRLRGEKKENRILMFRSVTHATVYGSKSSGGISLGTVSARKPQVNLNNLDAVPDWRGAFAKKLKKKRQVLDKSRLWV